MNKDTQTTIAGAVAALALIAKWVCSLFGYNLEIGADVLNAIAIIGGIFCAWKIGKPQPVESVAPKTDPPK